MSDPPDHLVHTTVTVEDMYDVWDERPLYHIDNFNTPVSVYSPRLTSDCVTSSLLVSLSLSFLIYRCSLMMTTFTMLLLNSYTFLMQNCRISHASAQILLSQFRHHIGHLFLTSFTRLPQSGLPTPKPYLYTFSFISF